MTVFTIALIECVMATNTLLGILDQNGLAQFLRQQNLFLSLPVCFTLSGLCSAAVQIMATIRGTTASPTRELLPICWLLVVVGLLRRHFLLSGVLSTLRTQYADHEQLTWPSSSQSTAIATPKTAGGGAPGDGSML